MPSLSRRSHRRLSLLWCSTAALLLASNGFLISNARAAEPIKPADFADLHKLIQPTAEESVWLSVNWSTDLWQAREKAATEGKPILLWEMDGHPLGCT
jgi:hypothetical protein